MKVIATKRGGGKTTQLVKYAKMINALFIVHVSNLVHYVKENFKYDNVAHIGQLSDLAQRGKLNKNTPVVIDDFDQFVKYYGGDYRFLNIVGISVTDETL